MRPGFEDALVTEHVLTFGVRLRRAVVRLNKAFLPPQMLQTVRERFGSAGQAVASGQLSRAVRCMPVLLLCAGGTDASRCRALSMLVFMAPRRKRLMFNGGGAQTPPDSQPPAGP